MDLRLQGLNAVVTGGTGGIGGEVVKMLAKEGCNVAFCSRSEKHVATMLKTLDSYSVKSIGQVLDASDTKGFTRWLQDLQNIDIFIPTVSAISTDLAETLKVDIQSTVQCIEAVIPYLRQSDHGAITYIGSLGTALAMPSAKPYGIAKAGMAHYMKSLSLELAPAGIRANTVSPGYTLIEGGTWDRWRQQMPEVYENAVRNNPLGRLGTGEEIARVVAFISSPAASFVTGADWFVDGASSLSIHG